MILVKPLGVRFPSLTLGDGRTIHAVGKMRAKIRLSRHTHLLDAIPTSFTIVEDLLVDVVLSNHFLRKYDILGYNQNQLQWVYFEEDIPGFLGGGPSKRGHGRILLIR